MAVSSSRAAGGSSSPFRSSGRGGAARSVSVASRSESAGFMPERFSGSPRGYFRPRQESRRTPRESSVDAGVDPGAWAVAGGRMALGAAAGMEVVRGPSWRPAWRGWLPNQACRRSCPSSRLAARNRECQGDGQRGEDQRTEVHCSSQYHEIVSSFRPGREGGDGMIKAA